MHESNDNQQCLNFDAISRADRGKPENPPDNNFEDYEECPQCGKEYLLEDLAYETSKGDYVCLSCYEWFMDQAERRMEDR